MKLFTVERISLISFLALSTQTSTGNTLDGSECVNDAGDISVDTQKLKETSKAFENFLTSRFFGKEANIFKNIDPEFLPEKVARSYLKNNEKTEDILVQLYENIKKRFENMKFDDSLNKIINQSINVIFYSIIESSKKMQEEFKTPNHINSSVKAEIKNLDSFLFRWLDASIKLFVILKFKEIKPPEKEFTEYYKLKNEIQAAFNAFMLISGFEYCKKKPFDKFFNNISVDLIVRIIDFRISDLRTEDKEQPLAEFINDYLAPQLLNDVRIHNDTEYNPAKFVDDYIMHVHTEEHIQKKISIKIDLKSIYSIIVILIVVIFIIFVMNKRKSSNQRI